MLETKTSSGNPSSYGGGYSARGTVMTNQDRSRYSVWAINRDKAATEITLNMPALAGKTLKANLASIGGGVTQVNNYDRQVIDGPKRQSIQLSFDAKGVARYTVAPNSVSGLSFAGTTR